MNNFLATNIDEQHLAEFKASAIAEDTIELNFRSWNPENENDLDEVFTFLVPEPEYRNNGTLAGRANEQLANTLRSRSMECGDGEIMLRICLGKLRKEIERKTSRLCTLT
jgi:hypothetical protein